MAGLFVMKKKSTYRIRNWSEYTARMPPSHRAKAQRSGATRAHGI
jgi:hypothetical protein